MSYVADRFIVLLDANVLYPFRMRDVLLRFAHAGLFRARWTQKILDEWASNLLAKRPDMESSIRTQQAKMREVFPEALVTDSDHLIAALDLPDPDDTHVLAAAIHCGAQHIVTENLKDFPAEKLAPYDIKAINADEFLARTFELYRTEALIVLRDLRHAYTCPPFTPSEFVFDLTAKGMPKLASYLHGLRAFL